MEVNANESIRSAVERGAGVAFLSAGAVAHDVAEGRLAVVKVRGFRPRRQLYLITDPARVPSSPARQFLAFLDQWPSTSGKRNR